MKRRSKIRLLGVVLAGGQSVRMGTDKGRMAFNGKTWCEQVFDTIISADIPAVVSVNERQQRSYSEIFPDGKLVVDQGTAYKGPLKGVYSVQVSYPEKDLLVVATDMVVITGEVIEVLAKAYNTNPGYDFYAYVEDDFYIPTAAIYTSNGLKKILMENERAGELSLQKILRSGRTFSVHAGLEEAVFLKNYNSRADIDFS